MLFASVAQSADQQIAVCSIGLEDDPQKAHWGPGIRDFFILHYVLEGKGYFNGMPVEQGQGFFIQQGALHEYHSDLADPWKYFWVIFKGEDTFLEKNLQIQDLACRVMSFRCLFFRSCSR